MHKFTIAVFMAVALAACASAGETSNKAKGVAAYKDDARLGEKVDKICFKRNIDGFSENTKDTIVLSSGVRKDYLVAVKGVCTNLSFAQSVAIDSSLSCVRRGDYLLVSDSAFGLENGAGLGPDRCYIDSIHKWDKRAKQDDRGS